MNNLIDTVKSILFFLLLMTFVGMILPNEKYKRYINMVMGLILIIVIITPIVDFIGKGVQSIPLTQLMPGIGSEEIDESAYQQWQQTYLRSSYEEQIAAQLTSLIESEGYVADEIDIEMNPDLTALTYISAVVSVETPAKKSFIRIEPVKIGSEDEEADEYTQKLKNLISSFYNMSPDNIYIVLRS